jgi:predicted  nucleic acid-binding Zn-ribbon protein
VYGAAKYPCITVTIPEVGYERTEKNWIKELQIGTKSRVIDENGEMSIFGAIIKDISLNPMNIYSKLTSQDSVLQLLVSFELKKDIYISKSTGDAELIAAKEYLKEFARNQYIGLIREEVMAEEKELRDLNTELNSLQNAKSRMQRSIQSNQTLIKEMKDNIIFQNSELTKVSADLVSQNDLLSSMEEGSAKEEKASFVKELEKRKKKILNEIESSENKITRANSEINEAEREIPRNESQQETMRAKINQQEAIVNKFNDKLNTVKAW